MHIVSPKIYMICLFFPLKHFILLANEAIQFCFFFFLISEVVGEKHRCYVCVPNTGSSISEVLHMFPNGPVVPLCNQFQVGDPEYIRECPSPSYQGCLTQTNGSYLHIHNTLWLLIFEIFS